MRTTKIFAVYDKIAQTYYTIGLATTAGAFVRGTAPMMSRVNPNFEDEFFLYELGELDEDTLGVKCHTIAKLLSWDVYKTPESPAVKMDNSDLGSKPCSIVLNGGNDD